jgi:formaldehyde-activating enzyme involved in methanogenesis
MKTTKLAYLTFAAIFSFSAVCAPAKNVMPSVEQDIIIKEKKAQVAQIWSFYKVKDSEESRRDFFNTLKAQNIAQTDYCAPIPDCIFPDFDDGH